MKRPWGIAVHRRVGVLREGEAGLRRLARVAALAAICALAAGGVSPARAIAASPIAWSTPALVDDQAPFAASASVTGVSCVGSSVCVAVGNSGRVASTLDPTAGTPSGSAAKWSLEGVDGENNLTGVACPSSSLCVAVDNAGNVVTTTDPIDGATAMWTVTNVDGVNSLNGVSCTSSPLLCVAVDNVGNVLTSTDPAEGAPGWTSTTVDGSTLGGMTAVSCASSGPSSALCVAADTAGNVITSNNPTAGASATWTPHNIDGTNNVTSVSCTTSPSSLCVAVDKDGNSLTSTDGGMTWGLLNFDGRKILKGVSCPSSNLCVAVDTSAAAWTSTNPTAGPPSGSAAKWTKKSIESGGFLGIIFPLAVSCPSVSMCVASDDVGRVLTSANPTSAATATWTPPEVADGTNSLVSVSCVAASLCVAVDTSGNAVTSTDPSNSAFPTWSVAAQIDPTAHIYGVSCPSSSLCVAVDNHGNVLTTNDPTDGPTATWTPQDVDGSNLFAGVSCITTGASSTLCVAVDEEGDVLTSTDPTGGGATWTPPQDVDGQNPFAGVSCTSSTLCAAVDTAGNVLISTDPTDGAMATWTPENARGGHLNAVSCPSISLCVAVNTLGDVVTSTDPTDGAAATWTAASVDAAVAGSSLTGISCPSSSLCVAVDNHGDAVFSNDPADGPTAAWFAENVYGKADLTAVSCAPSLCAAVDSDGTALSGSGHVLTAAVAGTGLGEVVSDDGLIFCPAKSCSSTYALGAKVKLTPAANPGSTFTGWSGGGCSGAGPCTVTMGSDQSVTATFAMNHALTVAVAGSGSGSVTSSPAGISCPGACTNGYAPGTMVTLSPAASAGSTFTGWSGGGCSGTAPCTVTMSADQDVTATFTLQPHVLTVTPAGSGAGAVTGSGISCPGTCSDTYAAGTTVTLIGAASTGSTFAGWSGGGCSGTGTCSVTMNADQTVTATFTSNPAPSVKPSCTLRPNSTRVKIRSQRTLTLTARCDQAAKLTLTGKIMSVAKTKRRKQPKARTFDIGAPSAQAKAGLPLTLTVKLPAAALKSGAHDSVVFTLTAVNANGSSTTTTTIAHLVLM